MLAVNLNQRSHLPARTLRRGQDIVRRDPRRVDPKRLGRDNRIAAHRYVIAPHVDMLRAVFGPWRLPLRRGALADVQSVAAFADRVAENHDAATAALGDNPCRRASNVA